MAARQRGRIDVGRLEEVLDRIARQRVVVVGDVILDAYVWGSTERVSPEAPVPVVRVEHESAALGGAGNVAVSAAALGASCTLCGVIGDDEAGQQVRALARAAHLGTPGIVVESSRATTTKQRIVARGRQVLRIDRETDGEIGRGARARVLELLRKDAPDCDGAILVDYAKGCLPRAFAREIAALLGELGTSFAADPKHDLTGLRGAALVKPNRGEAIALAGLDAARGTEPERLIARLGRRLPDADWAITDGPRGMTVQEVGGAPVHIPTAAREVFDVQGAGDTTMAALWLARLAGGSLVESALLANAAAGVVVGKIGTASARADEVRERLPEVVDAFRESE
jgi:D-beta-D-heptose 7-phosphate kinase/D-beta-D-heptose 1-phosphate adenosyltransferase